VVPRPGPGHPVLVAGQDGVLGRAVLARLRARGLETWGTTRRPPPWEPLTLPLDLSVRNARLPEPPRFRAAVLCAGATGQAACAADPAGTRAVNVDGVLRLAAALLDRGTRVVFLSSDAVFAADSAPGTEGRAPAPLTEYGRQKAAAEAALLDLDRGRGLVQVCRLGKVLHRGMPLLREWVEALGRGQAIAPFADLRLAPVSLARAAAALAELALSGPPGIIHLGGVPDLTYGALAEALAVRLGRDPGLVRAVPAPDALRPLPAHAGFAGGLPQPLGSVLDDLLAPVPEPAALVRETLGLRAAGRPEAARDVLCRALEQAPWNRELLVELGEVHFKLNRSEEGLACWRMAGGPAPGWDGDFQDPVQQEELAARWADASLARPAPLEAKVKAAELLAGAGRFQEAFALWKVVFAARPDWIEVHKRFTAALLFCGELALADAAFQARVDWANAEARRLGLNHLGVRFLRDFTTHIGHLGLLDGYVKAGLLGRRSQARPVVLFGRKPVANPCYLDYWRRQLPDMVASKDAYGRLEGLVDFLEDHTHGWLDRHGHQRITYAYGDYVQVQAQWERERRRPLLALEPGHAAKGAACLRAMGVPEGAWFVGLHVREDRWDRVRDARVESYLPAIRAITARGGWVVRMGDPAMTPLPSLPQVADYALGPHKSDWMDVYLWAAGRFFVGTLSGPYQIPPTFGRPCLLTNVAPVYAPAMYGEDLILHKRYFMPAEKRFLPLPELVATGIGLVSSCGHLASLGVELVDNTPEEIREAVEEMLDRVEGRPVPDDPDLQAAFRRAYEPVGGTNGRIGRDFARRHADWLGVAAG